MIEAIIDLLADLSPTSEKTVMWGKVVGIDALGIVKVSLGANETHTTLKNIVEGEPRIDSFIKFEPINYTADGYRSFRS